MLKICKTKEETSYIVKIEKGIIDEWDMELLYCADKWTIISTFEWNIERIYRENYAVSHI
jgi:hypothetical protein